MPPETIQSPQPQASSAKWVWLVVATVVIGGIYLITSGTPASAPGTPTATSTEEGVGTPPIPGPTNSGNPPAGTTYQTDLFRDTVNKFSYNYPYAFSLVPSAPGDTVTWMFAAGTTTGALYSVVAVPQNFLPGTNFNEARFTVGASSKPDALGYCAKPRQYETAKGTVTLNGVVWNKLQGGVSNNSSQVYVMSYRTLRGGKCWAVEYSITSTSLGNATPGKPTVAFTKSKVETPLQAMVASFKFLP